MSISSVERGSAVTGWMYTTVHFLLFLWENARKHLPNYHVIVCDTLLENRQEDERALACERNPPPEAKASLMNSKWLWEVNKQRQLLHHTKPGQVEDVGMQSRKCIGPHRTLEKNKK